MTTRLDAAEAERLRSLPFTYDCVGATATAQIDAGYHSFTRIGQITSLPFDVAVERLMTWQVHERAGLRVAASSDRVRTGEVVLMRLGLGAASLRIPCRVAYTIEEPDRVGFAYGTLPGHPETGEEQFLIERTPDTVQVRVHAFSRPSSRLARLSGPLGRGFQHVMTDRYLRAAGTAP